MGIFSDFLDFGCRKGDRVSSLSYVMFEIVLGSTQRRLTKKTYLHT